MQVMAFVILVEALALMCSLDSFVVLVITFQEVLASLTVELPVFAPRRKI